MDRIGVIFKGKVSITVKEVAVDGAALVIPRSSRYVLTFYHRGVGYVFWFVNHGCVGLQVGPVVPCILMIGLIVGKCTSEEVAESEARPARVVLESFACKVARINLWEVVYPSINRNDRNATPFSLIATTNHGSYRPSKC